MQRITFFSFLLTGLLFVAGCNTPPSTTTTGGDTTDTSTPAQPAMGQTPTNAGGADYTVTTIDTTIKSPRKELKGKVGGVDVTINYGSPSANERTIYGELVPYGKVWRTGANEATRVTFGSDAKVGEEGKMLTAGTYSLFTLPADKDNWTIIFNKTADQWGAYDYSETDDAVRVKGSSAAASKMAEQMDFAVSGNNVELMWADLKISFPVTSAAK